MSTLITSDIHLTDNQRDYYRWDLFDWLKAKAYELEIDQIIFLGDITDNKDHHSATLVNKLLGNLVRLSQDREVIILKGNHDYIDPTNPFFGFSNMLENVFFITDPHDIGLRIGKKVERCLFLPSSSNWMKDWSGFIWNDFDYIFTHATFSGCKLENGTILDAGIPTLIFKDYKGTIYSGDIHVPQTLKNIQYVGAPYRIKFGDTFIPRVLYIDSNDTKLDLFFSTVSKHTLSISNLKDLENQYDLAKIKENDQVKVKVLLTRSEYPVWKELKDKIVEFSNKNKFELFGPELVGVIENSPKENELDIQPKRYKSPKDYVTEYSQKKKLDSDFLDVGLNIIDQIKS